MARLSGPGFFIFRVSFKECCTPDKILRAENLGFIFCMALYFGFQLYAGIIADFLMEMDSTVYQCGIEEQRNAENVGGFNGMHSDLVLSEIKVCSVWFRYPWSGGSEAHAEEKYGGQHTGDKRDAPASGRAPPCTECIRGQQQNAENAGGKNAGQQEQDEVGEGQIKTGNQQEIGISDTDGVVGCMTDEAQEQTGQERQAGSQAEIILADPAADKTGNSQQQEELQNTKRNTLF